MWIPDRAFPGIADLPVRCDSPISEKTEFLGHFSGILCTGGRTIFFNDLVLREAGLRHVNCMVQVCQLRPYGQLARFSMRIPHNGFSLVAIRRLNHAEEPPACFAFVSDGDSIQGNGRGGPGVFLGVDQTEDEGVPSQGGRGDALLRRMSTSTT